MISLNIHQLLEGRKTLKKKRADVIRLATAQYRSNIMAMYVELLMVSPQFSGDFVGNWDIETLSTSARGYTPNSKKGSVESTQQPLDAGHTGPDFQSARMRGLSRLKYVQLGEPIYFVNPTPIKIDSPEVIGPEGDRKDLRNTSVITAWESIHAHLQAKYGSTK